jgi:hypothetical protein
MKLQPSVFSTTIKNNIWIRFVYCFMGLGLALVNTLAWPALPSVPPGFTINAIVSGFPVGTADELQDIAPGPGGTFGTDLYFIAYKNQIWRVSPTGGTPILFATVGSELRVLSFGFESDLYAVNGNPVPTKIYRIKSDGTFSEFSVGVPTLSEGIAYSPGGAFGNNLFLSEFDNYPNPISTIDPSGVVNTFTKISGSYRLTGLAFAPGGSFGTDLFGVDHNGTIYKIAPNGSYTQFAVNPPIGQDETLAFGSPYTTFGENLFVTPDGGGNLIKITPAGESKVFASGFMGFDYAGVTGLKFSKDKKMLFVTDDHAGTIYNITQGSRLECSKAKPSADLLWPPNHKFVPISILGVADPEGDPVTIKVTSVYQDEAVNAKGSGNTAPDGQIDGTNTAQVRAERIGDSGVPGNGRVYHIGFTAEDDQGGSCQGEVLVGVPHDQGQGATPVDDGALYDSTQVPSP